MIPASIVGSHAQKNFSLPPGFRPACGLRERSRSWSQARPDGARFAPGRLVLITPPWNFPVAIPIGGVLAALATGSAAIIKPAPPTPGCVEVACEAVHAALAAAGMARYGERHAVAMLLGEIYGSAAHFQMRLPELFCGFVRETGEPPIAYPVACLPQAWAAGSVFLMLQAVLGIEIDAADGLVEVSDPTLPTGLHQMSILGLEVGDGAIDLTFQRLDGHVVVMPRERRGAVSLRVTG